MTIAEMAEPSADDIHLPAAPRRIALRLALAAIALIELVDATSIWIMLHGDLSGLGTIVKLNLIVHPVLALSALVFALIGYVRHAIPALGAIVLMTWLKDMPSVVAHGYDFNTFFALPQTSIEVIAFPLVGACAIALAARDQRLGIATLLVAIPTLYKLFNGMAFLIGVMIYGF
jgi:hypothetical protein